MQQKRVSTLARCACRSPFFRGFSRLRDSIRVCAASAWPDLFPFALRLSGCSIIDKMNSFVAQKEQFLVLRYLSQH